MLQFSTKFLYKMSFLRQNRVETIDRKTARRPTHALFPSIFESVMGKLYFWEIWRIWLFSINRLNSNSKVRYYFFLYKCSFVTNNNTIMSIIIIYFITPTTKHFFGPQQDDEFNRRIVKYSTSVINVIL